MKLANESELIVAKRQRIAKEMPFDPDNPSNHPFVAVYNDSGEDLNGMLTQIKENEMILEMNRANEKPIQVRLVRIL
jgi:hypothetical protein